MRFSTIYCIFAILTVFSLQSIHAQIIPHSEIETHPKREFRSVWLTTVGGADWPKTHNTELQKSSLKNILKRSKELGLNAVVMQIVSRGDAIYPSERLPWAPWISGQPGVDPGWDPLAFAIEETHRLGMEFHAWYNVYKIGDDNTPMSSTREPLHVVFAHPEWVEDVEGEYWLNPAFPDQRQWHIDNVLEIVENYDVDAVHFDFIRYDSGGYLRDNQLMMEYNPSNKENLHDWRRENINIFVRDVYDAVKNVRPWVKVGSTPVGHYKESGTWPYLSGYSAVYQDSRRWLEEEKHDYLAPQLYWGIGQDTDNPVFEWLVDDWMSETYDRHVYIGMAPYKSGVLDRLPDHVDTVRAHDGHGQVSFRYDHINDDPSPFGDRYDHVSLIPVMDWENIESPTPPAALRYERIPGQAISMFRWDHSEYYDQEGTVPRYVMYQFPDPSITVNDLEDAQRIVDITGENEYRRGTTPQDGNYFVVTALSRNAVESDISNIFELTTPDIPVAVYPEDNAEDIRDTVVFVWESVDKAGAYHLQVATDPAFSSGFLVNISDFTDTTFLLTGMIGQEDYYWRTRAENPVGVSETEVYSFRTAFPAIPALAAPARGTTDIPGEFTLHWNETEAAQTYRVQIATTRAFQPAATVFDTVVESDTMVTVSGLEGETVHFWRVRASNEFGNSQWSGDWSFQTAPVTLVDDGEGLPDHFALRQNYPNPFNPATTIEFSVPHEENVTLIVYDVLGREVAELYNGRPMPGTYRVTFDASSLPSGVYLYRIQSDSYTKTKRMVYIK